MQRFYRNYDSIHQLTLSLDYHQDKLECAHCLKNDQFVSHGNVYKQRSIEVREKVGKRIFCSNRYGRGGCGRTFQLYISTEIPAFRYGGAHLFIFISALLANHTVCEAYSQATAQSEFNNAWRWLKRLMSKLSLYRSFLKCRTNNLSFNQPHSNSGYCRHLLPTLARLFTSINNGCFDYQLTQQRAFF